MVITIHPELEAKLRARAEATGVSVETYIERIARDDQAAEDEIEDLALEGLNSGDPIEIDAGYWDEKHRILKNGLRRPARGEPLRCPPQGGPGSGRPSLLLRG